jgi:hypothetical protein
MRNLLNILLALDAFLFSLICWGNVYPGEYASSAAYRLDMQGKWQGWIFRPLIDAIFGHLHCYDSWLMQSNMTQSPKNINWPREP